MNTATLRPFPGRSSDSWAKAYLLRLPNRIRSVPLCSFRSQSPLRGSSGFAPASLFNAVAAYLGVNSIAERRAWSSKPTQGRIDLGSSRSALGPHMPDGSPPKSGVADTVLTQLSGRGISFADLDNCSGADRIVRATTRIVTRPYSTTLTCLETHFFDRAASSSLMSMIADLNCGMSTILSISSMRACTWFASEVCRLSRRKTMNL